MATCYYCNALDASLKREVYTGRTKRFYYGKRFSMANSNNYGLRSFCSRCAGQIDHERNLRTVVMQLIVVFFLLYIYFK